MEIVNTLLIEINNRERSIIIWTTIFLIYALSRKEIRSSLVALLKSFFVLKITIPTVVLICYVFSTVYLLFKVGYWKDFLLKDTLIWFFGFAFIIFINSNKANEENGYFKKVFIDNFKLFVVIQFIVNSYVFNLSIELIITPISTLLMMMSVYTGKKEEYRVVHKMVNYFLFIIGSVFILFSFSKAFTDFNNFLTSNLFQKLTLPLALTICLIPFIYLMAIFILYENIFLYLSFKEYLKDNLKHIKFNLIATCNLNLNRLKKFRKNLDKFDMSTKKGVALAMENVKSQGKQ